jgi:ribonucleotide monophosphatase NagD (HAD superfamily)
VLAGATATFSVVAAGSSPLSYQWRLNGANLNGANGTALTLTNVQLAQSGSYTAQVTNLYGSATSSNAVLTVNPVLLCVPPPSGLVSWWAAEGNTLDSIGTNNGVLFPGAGFGAGEVGQAFSFNGTTQCVTVPYSRSLVTTNYSVEAWVKPLAQVSDPLNQDLIIGQAYGWQLIGRPGTSGISIVFLFATSKSSFYSVASTSDLPIGQFSHVVGTWDGTTLRLYINGALNAQKVPGARPVDLGYDIYIGGSYSVAGGFAGQYFNGLIDEASYYGRALSAAEIQTLYTAGSAGKCQTPVPPSIQVAPQNQAVPPGGTASFIVVASGTSPLSYQWHFNGAGMAGATSSVLTLTNVQLASVGTYAVTVTNLYGSARSAGATLTLLGRGACTPAPAGLVSWWAAEGTAADAVGTNNGVLFPGAGFTAGEVGQAFSFNGTTQCVTVPYSRSLVTTNYSVEAWVKPLAQVSDPLNQDLIIGQAYGWQLIGRPGTTGISVEFLFATSKSSFYSVASTSDLPIGQFSHVVGTWDGTTLRLYINGVLSAQRVPGATPVDLGYDIYIGGSYSVAGGFAGQYFNGLIDEASYYSRALSASEIQAIYNAGDAGKCPVGVAPSILTQPASQAVSAGGNAAFSVTVAGTPPLSYQWQFSGTNIPGATGTSLTLSNMQATQAGSYSVRVTNTFGSIMSSNALLTVISSPTCATPPSGLVSWWRAEGSASDGVDSNNGTLLNGASFASGMVGQAFSFNGSYQCVQIPHAASLVASNYSIEAWVKPLAQVSDPIDQDLIFGQSFGHCQLVARTGSSGVRLAFSFGTSHTSFYEAAATSEIPIGQFSHLAGTWDGTTLRLYINGVLNAQSTPHASPVDSGCSFYIGGFYSPTADSCGYVGQFFNGLIDEASYYNRALSGAEIQSIYNAGGAGKCLMGAAPTIIRQPANRAVHAGATATFSVTAAGTPPLSYQWRFRGANIAGATSASLTLSNVQPVQAGSYAVRVTNPFGSIMSSNVLLMVNRMRLQVSLNPDGTTRLHFLGSNSQSYRIEVSPDMLNWVSLGICTADAEGNVEFTDPNVAKQPLGFYRAVER